MALSLTAEQKSLKNLFLNEDQYIIPVYQRPYSWTNEHCIQLYNDITEAYDNRSDYFIGNLVFARADNNESLPNIIDGQQRIITIWLFIKALYLLLPDMKILKRALQVEAWEGDCDYPKISSKVPPLYDNEAFKNVLSWSLETTQRQVDKVTNKAGKINENICNTHVEANFICIFNCLNQYFSNISLLEQKGFLTFFMNQVYMLPIDLKGPTIEDATNKALTIFETLNNRGLNLEDADIFKASMYDKALVANKSTEFIDWWSQIAVSCSSLNISLDDLFRYYFHIVRGKNRIISKEKKLRDFFIREEISPLNKLDFEDVINDLISIQQILFLIDQLESRTDELSVWLKIINAYSNFYPRYVLVAYLYTNGTTSESQLGLLDLAKSIVRYCYSMGSTTSVKFEIYNIISRICNKEKVDEYYQETLSPMIFNKLGRLKKGLVLLAHQLRFPEDINSYYDIDILIRITDFEYLSSDWSKQLLEDNIDKLANYVVLSIAHKNIPLIDKYSYYMNDSFCEPKNVLRSDSTITYQQFLEREKVIEEVLSKFFLGKNYNE